METLTVRTLTKVLFFHRAKTVKNKRSKPARAGPLLLTALMRSLRKEIKMEVGDKVKVILMDNPRRGRKGIIIRKIRNLFRVEFRTGEHRLFTETEIVSTN